MRATALIKLLKSIQQQFVYPDEILIIDGSINNETELELNKRQFLNLIYHKVPEEHRGLTKQRNFGVSKVALQNDIIAFLDDDVELESNYFKELLNTYLDYPKALAVGGYITNELHWQKVEESYSKNIFEYEIDGYKIKESSRFIARRILGLDSNVPCGFSPEYSHGRSVSFLPPSGKTYEVEQLMGGVSSFRREVFDKLKFSEYFEGYGLYEDADFTLRVSKIGELYINTKARLAHYHEPSGRPNFYKYGKMVVRNGWYVWRVKNKNPSVKAKIKWYLITFLLVLIRATNILSPSKYKDALPETIGRLSGLVSLFVNKPK